MTSRPTYSECDAKKNDIRHGSIAVDNIPANPVKDDNRVFLTGKPVKVFI